MLDAFKKSGKPARNQAEELEALIATSREERAALSTMLTQMQLQTTKLATAGKSLQEVDEKAGKAHARLDEVIDRLAKADAAPRSSKPSTRGFSPLRETLNTGRAGDRPADGPGGALEQHQQAVQALPSQAAAPGSSWSAARDEQGTLE